MIELFWVFIFPVFIIGMCLFSPIILVVLWNLIKDFVRGNLPFQLKDNVDKKEIGDL